MGEHGSELVVGDLAQVGGPTPEAGYVVYEDTRRAAAGRRLDRTLSQLREAGIPAHGLVLETDPEAAILLSLVLLLVSVVVLVTLRDRWLRGGGVG